MTKKKTKKKSIALTLQQEEILSDIYEAAETLAFAIAWAESFHIPQKLIKEASII